MCSAKKNSEHKWETCGRKLSLPDLRHLRLGTYWKALQNHVKVFCLPDSDLNLGGIEYEVETRPNRR
jgi:hypothetical protein